MVRAAPRSSWCRAALMSRRAALSRRAAPDNEKTRRTETQQGTGITMILGTLVSRRAAPSRSSAPRRPAPHLAPSTRWRLLWPSRSRRSVSCVYHVHDAQPLFFPRLPAPIPFLFLSSPWAFFPRIPFLSLSLPFIRSFLPLIPSSNSLSPSLSLLLISLLSALQTPRGMGQRLRCCLTRWRR